MLDLQRARALKSKLSSPYHPESNGHAESAVKCVKQLLAKCKNNFVEFRKRLLEWRNTPRADGYSPSDMFWGRRQRTRLPALTDAYARRTPTADAEACRDARARKTKAYFDKRARAPHTFTIGQAVWAQDPRTRIWSEARVVDTARAPSYHVVDAYGYAMLRNERYLRPNSRPRLRPREEVESHGSPDKLRPSSRLAKKGAK